MGIISLTLAFVSMMLLSLICSATVPAKDKLYDGELLHE
jgi:hypothetical protein